MTQDNLLFFFESRYNEYSIGTPKGIAKSDGTIDISFKNFAKNYNLQSELKLASVFFMNHLRFEDEFKRDELYYSVAYYLTASKEDKEELQKRKYLINNGLLRILVIDDSMLENIKKLV